MSSVRRYFGRFSKKTKRPDSAVDSMKIVEADHVYNLDITKVTLDNNSQFGVKGLPRRFKKILGTAGISMDLMVSNTDDVLKILETHFNDTPKIPTRAALDKMIEGEVQFNTNNPYTNNIKLKRIGRGAHGEAWACRNVLTNEIIAIKETDPAEETMDRIKCEISIMALTQHENIVKLLGCYHYTEKVYILLEYMNGGALTRLCDYDRDWPEAAISYVMVECFKGLECLHSYFRIHRDIKSDNILFDMSGRIKLADFGSSIGLTAEEMTRKTTLGTPLWMAPELIKGEAHDMKVDSWSLGIVGMEMAEGKPPLFKEDNNMRVMFLIVTEEPPKLKDTLFTSSAFLNIISRCLRKDPNKRCGARVALMHPFFKQSCSRERFAELIPSLLPKPKE